MNVDKFRGGRAIPDLEVIELYNEVFDISHVLTRDDKHDFVSLFDNHIKSSNMKLRFRVIDSPDEVFTTRVT